MIRQLQSEIASEIQKLATELFGQAPERVAFSRPPKIELGDLATPCALELGKRLGKKPREVAEALAQALAGRHPWIHKIEIAGPGYLNIYLHKAKVAGHLQGQDSPVRPHPARGKVIVEHTNINPNKAAHIGHLRNAVLGDTLGRLLRELGETTEIQNYIDDTGVQVADVVVGLLHKAGLSADDAVAWIKKDERALDKRCWDLYASVTKWYEEDKAREQLRRDALHAIEHGEGEAHRVALALVPGILRCHLATMARLGIRYDVLTHESVVLARGFFKTAFERMKTAGAVHLETAGKNEGCWTMRLQDDPEFAGMEDADKVIVRSNGTVTYVGKDLAYQMWKLGLLGADFHYGKFTDFDGLEIAQTKPEIETTDFEGKFGHGQTVINVIDNRQSYLQKVIGVGLRKLGHAEAASRSIHFNYEMVALSPAAAKQLGVEIAPDEEKKPYIEMSGRRGLGVIADDLLTTLHIEAIESVVSKNKVMFDQLAKFSDEFLSLFEDAPRDVVEFMAKKVKGHAVDVKFIHDTVTQARQLTFDDPRTAEGLGVLLSCYYFGCKTYDVMHATKGRANYDENKSLYKQAEMISIAAIRYYMIKYGKAIVLPFDFKQALAFEGETGPYLLYTAVRARNILAKAAEAASKPSPDYLCELSGQPADALDGLEPEAQALLMELFELPKIYDAAITTLEMSLVARHFFNLAQSFNNWYHKYPVTKEGVSPEDRARRLKFVQLFLKHYRGGLERGLGLPVPERM